MTAGLARGLTHENAARFAFLMAAPIILAAGVYKLPDLFGHLGNGVRGQALVGAIVAGVVSVFAISFLLRFLKTKNLRPFGVYCIALGISTVFYLTI
jgi:undecaprenyl-diphosphatase